MNKVFFTIVFFLFSFYGMAQQVKIGVMRTYKTTVLEMSHGNGVYDVYGDSSLVTSIWEDQMIRFKRSGEKIKLVKGDKTLGYFNTVYLKERDEDGYLKVQSVAPSVKKLKKYEDNFIIVPDGSSRIMIINEVDMANYLAGVVESEGGGGKHIEYYKVQAILSRTYALDHLNKHVKEGFNLCSDVHCQAYHNMMRYTPTIDEAIEQTQNLVMIDEKFKLADGFFFANCGGQTSEADFVWNNQVNYCKSVKDTFCIHSKQANWTKKIDKYKWRNYLVNHFGFPEKDSIYGQGLYTFFQENRKAFYLAPQLGIPLRDLRVNFNLKSTWFTSSLKDGDVVLEGKGFGHGVGLCQEGAMRMAKLDFKANEILNFYFTGIRLIDYYYWSFVKQREHSVAEL